MSPSEFNSILELYFSNQIYDVSESDYRVFEGSISLLERLAEVQTSSVLVFDFYKRNYLFKRIHYSNQIGHDNQKIDELGLNYFVSLIHPEDYPILLDTYQKALIFLESLPIAEKKDYKLIYTFRAKGKDGKFYPIIDQVVILELDKKGKIWLLLAISDFLPSKGKMEKASRQLINIKTKTLYLFNNNSNYNEKQVLSTREIEILGLVSKGFASKEIAEKLFISVNTVNNHRQHILEKINAANTAEAVSYARNLGFI
jgi:DNA-binding CsgD family transcriptional regulator